MWIRVRSMDGRTMVHLEDISKLTKIEQLREKLIEHFHAEPSQQRLFFRGKQMEDGQTLFDYDVNLNDIIQILVREKPKVVQTAKASSSSGDEGFASNKENSNAGSDYSAESCKSEPKANEEEVPNTIYYKVKDRIDCWDEDSGCWYEGQIVKITSARTGSTVCKTGKTRKGSVLSKCDDSAYGGTETNNNIEEANVKLFDVAGNVLDDADDGFLYHIYYTGFEDGEPCKVKFNAIRPCSYKKLTFNEINVGDTVLSNYNIEEPKKRGFWYDTTITKKNDSRTNKELLATVLVRRKEIPLDKCKLAFPDEIFRIEKPVEISSRAPDLEYWMQVATLPKREIKPDCDICKDRKTVKCKHCSCCVCGGKDQPNKQILCDECNRAFHLWCLDPPMESLPEEEDWYCRNCKNDVTEVVRAGEKLKQSKRKAKMPSTTGKNTRDWGKGMACVGRTKECTIVKCHHLGPIPGIEVGASWKFRLQVCEAGVHRPCVAGIHGKDLACSLVLAGGYEDDQDDGEEFTYTGSGGRDLTGNKRTARQSSDQELTRTNRCLAANCDAKVNDVTGAVAANWKAGQPVRVLRSSNKKKHSKYFPEDGIRYDGIYKVVKYWPEKGKSGFIVWRYHLKRDDPTPAPWTKAGKKRMAELGLEMKYPEGYLEKQQAKKKAKEGKRASKDSVESNSSPKRSKQTNYKLPKDMQQMIKKDKQNKHLWDECLLQIPEGQPKFVSKVEELFLCVCCQDLVCKPVTTECCHNVCHSCLTRSFQSKMYSCPACRFLLGDQYSMKVNKTLDVILQGLFPGYAVNQD